MRSLRFLLLAAGLPVLLMLGGPVRAAQDNKADNPPAAPGTAGQAGEASPLGKTKVKNTKTAGAQAPSNPGTAQNASGRTKGGKGFRPGQTGGMDRRMDRLKQQLGSTDEEWLVIKPLLEEVIKAQSVDMPFRSSPRMGGKKGGSGKSNSSAPAAAPGDAAAAKPSPKATLSKILADEHTPAKEIQAQMDALREEQRLKAEALKAARAKLRPLLTLKQEATLLIQGYMD